VQIKVEYDQPYEMASADVIYSQASL
jgi:hypothetical protein